MFSVARGTKGTLIETSIRVNIPPKVVVADSPDHEWKVLSASNGIRRKVWTDACLSAHRTSSNLTTESSRTA